MANTLLTPDMIAKSALANLHENLVARPLVYSDYGKEFTGPIKVGDTVNIRKPAVFTAHKFNRANGITIQEATEESIPVKIDTIAEVSFVVTDEDRTLHIQDFQRQFLDEAMRAIAVQVDTDILSLRSDVTQTVGGVGNRTLDKPEVLIEAGRVLNDNNVPTEGRVAIVDTQTLAEWQDSPLIKEAGKSGSTDGLRKASIGKPLFGIDPYWTQNIKDETGVAFHKDAFSFTSAPLAVPQDGTASAVSYEGLNLRVITQYDIYKKQTVVSIDTLYGVKTIDPNRAVLLQNP